MSGDSAIRALFFIDGMNSPYAGTESQVVKLISDLSMRGIEVSLLAMAKSDFLESGSLPCNVEILEKTKLTSLATWMCIFRSARAYRRKGYRLVHFFFNDSALLGPMIFTALGFKTITSRRDMGIWYTPLRLKWLKFNRFFTSAYIANSEAVKAHTCANENAPKSRVKVIYNGYLPPVSTGLKVDFPFGKGKFIFGMVANLRPVKRIPDALRALALILPNFPDARLVVVGSHDPRDPTDFIETAEALNIKPYVLFAGRQDNVSSWIARFDVGVLCSESEGFSNAIIEYLQQGKPVICSEVGGNSEIITQGQNGYLYRKGDVEALAEKMSLIMENHKLREKLEREAIYSVNSRFSLDLMVDRHLTLYRSLCNLNQDASKR